MRLGTVLFLTLSLADAQQRVEYIGGTVAALKQGAQGTLDLRDDHYLAFYPPKGATRIPYTSINLIEYGQQVDRRIALAAISPLFLLSKSRKHFLTIGYTDDHGQQQALVFQVDKNAIRTSLVALEARTGQKVQYQDEEARKAGK